MLNHKGRRSESRRQEQRHDVKTPGDESSLLSTWSGEMLKCKVSMGPITVTAVWESRGTMAITHLIPEPFAAFLWYIHQPAAPIPLVQSGNTYISLPYYFAPTFSLFIPQGLWDKNLFLWCTATGSLRVTHLSHLGLSSAAVITFGWNKLPPKEP